MSIWRSLVIHILIRHMPRLNILRPDSSFTDEKKLELGKYCLELYKNSRESRSTQVDVKYATWDKNYYAEPLEKVRSIPWQKSSNIVVPLTRMFVDSYIARTLGIIFATRPLFNLSSYPKPEAEALQLYLNRKATQEWGFFRLTKDFLFRGAKNGTVVMKTVWKEDEKYVPTGDGLGSVTDNRYTIYQGPKTGIIPFDDFCVYPYTAQYLDEVKTFFHDVRVIKEEATEKVDSGLWDMTDEELQTALRTYDGRKREESAQSSGIDTSNFLLEAHVVESYLDYQIAGKTYPVVAVICPDLGKLVDVYFNPYVTICRLFAEYKPFPKEDLFYGEGFPQILQGFQEEVTSIHNDRRNNATVANVPVFKRKQGSLLPNPSTNWYPGKVFDLESMDDFEPVTIGRNYTDMIPDENQTIQLAERLIGQGLPMQGASFGTNQKGIYNTQGTLAVLSESNQRQDTNIADARQVVATLGRQSYLLQTQYGTDDPTIKFFPEDVQQNIIAAFKRYSADEVLKNSFEIKTSDAYKNSEAYKAALFQMYQVLTTYGKTVQDASMVLADPNYNPGLRAVLTDVVNMHKWMATRLLRAFDEHDSEEILPDVDALNGNVQGVGPQPAQPPGNGVLDTGGAGPTGPPIDRAGLQSLLEIPTPAGGGNY